MPDPTEKTLAELLAEGHTITIAPPAAAPVQELEPKAEPPAVQELEPAPQDGRPITDPAEIAELEQIAAAQEIEMPPEPRQVKVRRGGRVRTLDKPE